jgi:T4 gene Gp59 loader of gp41 DNA helicase/T4 gene Gp59 loader of gp41 DNA helicase C-term
MTGFETYLIYVSLKSHFSSETYDFFKYKHRVTANGNSYEKRPDRYFFEKIGSKYSEKKLVQFFVANFVDNPDIWIGEFVGEEPEAIYENWKKKQESFTYNFTDDCQGILEWLVQNNKRLNNLFLVEGSDHPIISKMVLQNVIYLESFVELEKIFKFCTRINRKIDDPIWQSLYLKTRKYTPFLLHNTDECKDILRKKIEMDFPEVK